MNRNAFTMLELTFVIVVLGILAAIAVPRFVATRDDAHISKARATISAVRAAIVSERQSRMLRGESMFISALDNGIAVNAVGADIFDTNGTGQLLMYPVVTGDAATNGKWRKTGNAQYTFRVIDTDTAFTYTQADGTFDCIPGNGLCNELTR